MAAVSALSIIKDWKAPDAGLYSLSGASDYLIDKIAEIICSQFLDPDFKDFNYTKIDCSSAKAAEITDALAELPMLTDKRVLELTNANSINAETAKIITPYLQECLNSAQTIVIMRWCGEKKTAGNFKTSADKLGLKIDCSLKEPERMEWIKTKLSELGLKASNDIVALIQQRTGSDLLHLSGQLEKLSAFVGKDGAITADIVTRIIKKSTEIKTWEFTSAIGRKKTAEAVRAAASIMEGNEQAEAFGLLSYTNSYLRSLAQAMSLAEQYGNNPAALAPFMPGKKEFQIRKTLEELNSWSEQDLAKAFEALCKADFRLKTGNDPRMTISLLILSLCLRKGRKKSF
ncbi:MAG: DNA polymerase III subunit delta [bacterium]|nr:DNA polymerase III subunit delta [bacterium]